MTKSLGCPHGATCRTKSAPASADLADSTHEYTIVPAKKKLGFHPDALLRHFTILADKGLHLDAIPSCSNICMVEVELGINWSCR